MNLAGNIVRQSPFGQLTDSTSLRLPSSGLPAVSRSQFIRSDVGDKTPTTIHIVALELRAESPWGRLAAEIPTGSTSSSKQWKKDVCLTAFPYSKRFEENVQNV
jgi:hypothetical protein